MATERKPPAFFKSWKRGRGTGRRKIRWLIGKRTEFLTSGNKYGEVFTDHEFRRAIDMVIVEEMEVQQILSRLREKARSVKELAQDLTIPSGRVFRYITALKRKEMVSVKTVSERSPIFQWVPQEV